MVETLGNPKNSFSNQNIGQKKSNTFYLHPDLDSCLIRIEANLRNVSNLMLAKWCSQPIKCTETRYRSIADRTQSNNLKINLSQEFSEIPCLSNRIDINMHNGAACWVAGWGNAEIDGVYSNQLQSIGLNLMSRDYCTDHSFWDIDEGYMCAGLPPNNSTPMTGWKHVTAGGKGICQAWVFTR